MKKHTKNGYSFKGLEYCEILHVGFVNDDNIQDFILGYNGYKFLWLSSKDDIESKKMFNLTKVWKTEITVQY